MVEAVAGTIQAQSLLPAAVVAMMISPVELVENQAGGQEATFRSERNGYASILLCSIRRRVICGSFASFISPSSIPAVKISIGQIPFCSYFLLYNEKDVSWKPKMNHSDHPVFFKQKAGEV
jgi:hypothetical protein